MLNIRDFFSKQQPQETPARRGDIVYYRAPWGVEYRAQIVRVESERRALINFWDSK